MTQSRRYSRAELIIKALCGLWAANFEINESSRQSSFDFLIENFNQGIVGDCLEIDFVGDDPFGKSVEDAVIKFAEVGRFKFEFLAFIQAEDVSCEMPVGTFGEGAQPGRGTGQLLVEKLPDNRFIQRRFIFITERIGRSRTNRRKLVIAEHFLQQLFRLRRTAKNILKLVCSADIFNCRRRGINRFLFEVVEQAAQVIDERRTDNRV